MKKSSILLGIIITLGYISSVDYLSASTKPLSGVEKEKLKSRSCAGARYACAVWLGDLIPIRTSTEFETGCCWHSGHMACEHCSPLPDLLSKYCANAYANVAGKQVKANGIYPVNGVGCFL